jgi:hypothetical protein
MKFAAKRLTRSDLTLFDYHYKTINVGKQKAINLNRDVFVDLIFPAAPGHAAGKAAQFLVSLRVFGPGGIRDVQSMTRKVIAAGGETIHDADDGSHTGRYNDLQSGDYALFGFEGGDLPDTIDMVLLSQNSETDAAVLAALVNIGGPRTMFSLSDADLAVLADAAAPDHPVYELVDPGADEVLEEAVLGSAAAVRQLRRRTIRRQSAEELVAARLRAQAVGRDGEVLVDAFLKHLVAEERIAGFVWESNVNAINPWDMTITRLDGSPRRVEVKTTSGPHDRGIHVSQAELDAAIELNVPTTQIWRISDLNAEGGVLRRSKNFKAVARGICDLCADFGTGLAVDSWTVDPARLEWGDAIQLRFDDDPED